VRLLQSPPLSQTRFVSLQNDRNAGEIMSGPLAGMKFYRLVFWLGKMLKIWDEWNGSVGSKISAVRDTLAVLMP
jgi:hypothetical protein